MSKRFIDNTILPKSFRKLDPSLKLTWFYVWTNCDKSGVYEIDEDLFEFENGIELNIKKFQENFDSLIEISGEKILLKDFIRIDCGFIRENYNPHKPVLRAIAKNKLTINSSLNQASFKLVDGEGDGDVEEEVDDEGKRGVGKKPKQEEIDEVLIWPTFEDFWEEYDKKVGDKKKIQKKWEKFNQDTKEEIMAYIPNYKFTTPEKKYRKNPETFFNNNGWTDELILPTQISKQINKEQEILQRAQNNQKGWD